MAEDRPDRPVTRQPARLLLLIPAIAIAVLVGPVAAGLAGAVFPALGYLPAIGGSTLTLEAFSALAQEPGLWRSCWISLSTGLATTCLSLMIVVVFVAGWQATRAFAVIARLVSPLLSVPHAAAAFGLAFLIAPSGAVMRLISPHWTGLSRPPDLLIVNDLWGLSMMAGLVIKEIPFLLLVTLAALPQTRARQLAEVTAGLGYGRLAGFTHAVMPLLYRQIRLPVLAVLAYATSVVDVAMILGPTTPAPLAVRIMQWQSDPDLSRRFVAAAGALLQLGVTAFALMVWLAGERMMARLCRLAAPSGRRFARDRPGRIAGVGAMMLSVALIAAGIAVLAVWSVAGPWRFPDVLPAAFSLSAWMRGLPGLSVPLANAVVIASAASLCAVVLALGALEYEARAGTTLTVRALIILYLPLLVPQIAFLFGLQIVLTRLAVTGTFAAMVLVHLVFVFPYVFLSLGDPWRNWDVRYAYMARALGHGDNSIFWRIRLPMLTRPVLTAAAVGFAVSIALYLPTLLVGGGRWPTVTTEAVALASGADRRLVGVTAFVQAILPFAGFGLALVVPAIVFRNRVQMRPHG